MKDIGDFVGSGRMGIEAGWTLGYDKLGWVGDILNRVVVDLGFGDSLMGVEAG